MTNQGGEFSRRTSHWVTVLRPGSGRESDRECRKSLCPLDERSKARNLSISLSNHNFRMKRPALRLLAACCLTLNSRAAIVDASFSRSVFADAVVNGNSTAFAASTAPGIFRDTRFDEDASGGSSAQAISSHDTEITSTRDALVFTGSMYSRSQANGGSVSSDGSALASLRFTLDTVGFLSVTGAFVRSSSLSLDPGNSTTLQLFKIVNGVDSSVGFGGYGGNSPGSGSIDILGLPKSLPPGTYRLDVEVRSQLIFAPSAPRGDDVTSALSDLKIVIVPEPAPALSSILGVVVCFWLRRTPHADLHRRSQ